MLTAWFQRFRRSATERELPITWLDVDAADAAEHPDLVVEILAQAVDGVTVRGVYTPEEMRLAAERVPHLRDAETPVVFGSTLGRPLMQSGMSQDRTEHVDDAQRHRGVYIELFGDDPHERIAGIMQKMAEGRPIVAPTEDDRPYNPGQIRIMEPDGGGLPAHAGNEFLISNEKGSASHLWATTDALDHLSYFLMVQEADEGGELSVYDLLWEDPRADGDEVMVPLTHDETEFDERPHLSITPRPGDLIVFRGGRRWHRVEPVHGTHARITYGGFAAPSRGDDAIHCWS